MNLNEVAAKVDLLEYASKSFLFRRVGKDTWSAKCNQHPDINPSLYITPSKNLWYCHGCGRGGNIINWLMVYENLSFGQAVAKLKKLTGCEIDTDESQETSSIVQYCRLIQKQMAKKPKKETEREILPESYMNQFSVIKGEPHEWLNEGITQEMLTRYGIRIDNKSNRIVYPVYDADGNLIGAKGRTRFTDYKNLGLQKYMNYTKIGTTDFFQGMREARDSIKEHNEVIIVEGIKSVMKLAGWGFQNAVAAETSRMNDAQALELLKLDVRDAVFAFDKDQSLEKVMESVNKIKRYMNTSVIIDKKGLLRDKDSPCDRGIDVWMELYRNRIKIYH